MLHFYKKRAKQKYYHSVINDTKHNIKVLWKTSNDITHYKKRSYNSISNLVSEIGENIVDPNATADMFTSLKLVKKWLQILKT